MSNVKLKVLCISFLSCILFITVYSCGKVDTPESADNLEEFHLINFESQNGELIDDICNLFVDYSTCNSLGQNSRLFQDIAASLVTKTSTYYSIRGNNIQKEEGDFLKEVSRP